MGGATVGMTGAGGAIGGATGVTTATGFGATANIGAAFFGAAFLVAFFTVRRTTFFDAFARVAFFAGFLVARLAVFFFAVFLFAVFFAGFLTVRLVAFFALFFAFFFVAIWFSAEGSCRYRLLEATA